MAVKALMDIEAVAAPGRPAYADWLSLVGDFHNRTVLVRLGPLVITTYSFIVGAAFAIGTTTALWFEATTGRHPGDSAWLHLVITLPAVFIGLRLFTIATEMHNLRERPLETLCRPGYTLHGGIFGGMTAILLISRITGVNVLFYFDCAALALTIGEAIGRVGCHVYGCCWGRPTSGTIGIRYTNPDASVLRNEPHLHGVKIHPTQLYTAIYAAVLFVLLLQLVPIRGFDGLLAALYGVLHSLGRVAIERLRQDNRGRIGARWTQTNLYSAILFVSGLAILAAGALLPLTPTVGAIRWIDVALDPRVVGPVALFGFFFFVAYGVGYKRVGVWVSAA
jgi:phosphatidylglycerol:prolipoprotein diacylglycerol transferase